MVLNDVLVNVFHIIACTLEDGISVEIDISSIVAFQRLKLAYKDIAYVVDYLLVDNVHVVIRSLINHLFIEE